MADAIAGKVETFSLPASKRWIMLGLLTLGVFIAFVDRTIIFLIPLLTILLPLFKLLPPTYRWRVRSRIYRWYRDLMTAEREALAAAGPEILHERLDSLDRL